MKPIRNIVYQIQYLATSFILGPPADYEIGEGAKLRMAAVGKTAWKVAVSEAYSQVCGSWDRTPGSWIDDVG